MGTIKIYDDIKKIDKGCNSILKVNQGNCYIKDLNVSLALYPNCLTITDLKNALVPGKECTTYILGHSNYNRYNVSFDCEFMNKIASTDEDFIKVIENILSGNFEVVEPFKLTQHKGRAIRTFSPFAKIKPIKEPKRWT